MLLYTVFIDACSFVVANWNVLRILSVTHY